MQMQSHLFIYSWAANTHTHTPTLINLITFSPFLYFHFLGYWALLVRTGKAIHCNRTLRKFVSFCFYCQHFVLGLIIKKNWTHFSVGFKTKGRKKVCESMCTASLLILFFTLLSAFLFGASFWRSAPRVGIVGITSKEDFHKSQTH